MQGIINQRSQLTITRGNARHSEINLRCSSEYAQYLRSRELRSRVYYYLLYRMKLNLNLLR